MLRLESIFTLLCGLLERIWCFIFTSSVQFSRSVMSDSLRPHESQHARPPSPSPTPRVHPNSFSITNSQSSSKLMCIESVMSSSHLILCHPLLLLPSVFPSIRVFCEESALHIRWPKYWSFILSPSNEYSGLISFRIDWFDLLAIQGILKSLVQHHSSKASTCSCPKHLLRLSVHDSLNNTNT